MLNDGTDLILLAATFQISLPLSGSIGFLAFWFTKRHLNSVLSYSLLISFALAEAFVYFSMLIHLGDPQTGRMAGVLKPAVTWPFSS